MKKLLSTIVLLAVSAGLATAGDYYSKAPVAPKGPIITPPPVCPCFDPGVELSLFGAGIFPEGDANDDWGGGVGVGMFFTPHVGVNVSYHAFNTDPSVLHFGTADLVLRMPIPEFCIAPYVFGGGGFVTNGSTEGLYRAGAGIDIRMDSMGCIGMFIDGAYNWVDDEGDSEAIVARVGFRIPF